MAQVEFIAAMVQIFRTWKLEAAVGPEETECMVREKLRKVVEASTPKMTLQIGSTKGLKIKWVKRV